MGRPSPFIAATQRITNSNIAQYILDRASKGKLLDAMVVDPVSLQRWLAERDIPKIEGIVLTADLATETEAKILPAARQEDSHVQAYHAFRLTVANTRRAGAPIGDLSKWKSDTDAIAENAAFWKRKEAEEAAKRAARKTAPAKPRSEKACATQAMKEMLERVAKGAAFDGLWVANRARVLIAEANAK